MTLKQYTDISGSLGLAGFVVLAVVEFHDPSWFLVFEAFCVGFVVSHWVHRAPASAEDP